MEKQVFNNTLTILTKEEGVKNLDHNILPNTSVLEIAQPFPGYYDSSFITSESKPQTLLILLKDAVSIDFFYRRIHNIKKYSDFNFSAAFAEIELNNRKYYAIRVFDLDAYDKIIELEKSFIDEGFVLKKAIKIDATAIIRIHKFCNLELIDEIYHSADDSHFIYIPAGKEITWKTFEHITLKIRHNYLGNKFDAGLAIIFHHNNIEDVVRLYSKDLNDDDISKLKAMYQKEITAF